MRDEQVQMIEWEGSPRTRCWWRWTPSRRHRARGSSPWCSGTECEACRRSAAPITCGEHWSQHRAKRRLGAHGADTRLRPARVRHWLTDSGPAAPRSVPSPPPAPPPSSRESSPLRPPDVIRFALAPRSSSRIPSWHGGCCCLHGMLITARQPMQ